MNSLTRDARSLNKPILLNGKRIGEIQGSTAVFFVSDRNWYRAGNGYSLDEKTLDNLDGSIDTIGFFDRKNSRRETISLSTFLLHTWRTKDFGWGKKLVCDCRWYDGRAPKAPRIPTVSKPVDPQGLLFPNTDLAPGMGA